MSGKQLKVLVVDDNKDSAQTLGWMLEILGYGYSLAHTGKDALSEAQTYRPDIIMLDLGLPEIDGFEVCERLRKIPELGDVKIVAQTGWSKSQNKEKLANSSFDDYLMKPIEIDVMKELLERVSISPAND